MRRANPSPASSGWTWNANGAAAPLPNPRRPSPPRRGSLGAVLAAVVFLCIVGLGLAYVVVTAQDGEAPAVPATEPDVATAKVPVAPERAPSAHAVDPAAAPAQPGPAAIVSKRAPPSLDKIAWTIEAPSTLRELSGVWSIPRDVLSKLNPGVSVDKRLDAGAQVIVHANTLGEAMSTGPPNKGRLTRGVPLPEGDGWILPPDRSRAFATTTTLAALLAGFGTYGQHFPDARPIQVGELSARRGGALSGHQSHQSGLDVDIRLIQNSTGDGFDGARNWFLVKSLLDGGSVTSIFLNATEQTWLRAAAQADVGAAEAAGYFAYIRHEPGHTIHMHVRFLCPKAQKRCVNYPLPDIDEQAEKKGKKLKSKLPSLPGATKPGATKPGATKLPTARPKPKGK